MSGDGSIGCGWKSAQLANTIDSGIPNNVDSNVIQLLLKDI